MARKKQYNEEAVIEKAMTLFWEKGYESTSVRMLEKEMGINQFSIYASFGSKHGVFLESLKCYKTKIKSITDKLKQSGNGVTGIREYFYDFIEFSQKTGVSKGCLVTNTVNELGSSSDPKLLAELLKFANEIKDLFAHNLRQDTSKEEEWVEQQASHLLISILGLSTASKVFDKKEVDGFIENVFVNLI